MAVTVLGKTFETEEERREYFQEELRKKLPELKKMEGFPIGDDEDIVELSDPPYYTACPNPWLNEFITKWESLKNPKKYSDENKPFASDVSVGKRNPVYSAHTYHTKVPHPAIMRYILHYTNPGDIVYDGFAGTGMTNVAASLCETVDSELKFEIENHFRKADLEIPKWGKRQSISKDLSPIASFIASNYSKEQYPKLFSDNANDIINEIKDEIGWLFKTRKKDSNEEIDFEYVVWSEVFSCNNCSHEINFYEQAVNEKDGKVSKKIKCDNCGIEHTKRSIDKLWVTEYDSVLGDSVKETKLVPVRVVYKEGTNKVYKKLDHFDKKLIKKVEKLYSKCKYLPTDILPKGYNTRQPIRSNGYETVNRFYFKRIAVFLDKLYAKCKHDNSLLLLFTSQITNLSKQNRHRPGVSYPYNPLNGVIYISSQVAEANPFKAYKNKIKRIAKAYKLLVENQVVGTGSATANKIKSDSIDYIFTDPPFGANIMYSELNFCIESWLKVKTNNTVEAIENKVQGKSLSDYNNLMKESFSEFYRILKPGKWMTVEFSNTSASVWNGIQTALQNSGFIVANVSSLDKKQGSFKAVTTVTAVKQDLVITCYKPSSELDDSFKENKGKDVAIWEFTEEHLKHLPIHLKKDNSTTAIIERSPKILFDRVVAFYVQKGYSVPLDASKFQKELRERFIERDGMFFTNEQVQEYDRKKAEVPNFTQLSILVASEQDGVLWLQNFLKNNPSTYQDIQPEWMQALGGERKGDIIPELNTILEENFLKNDAGEWYVPDPDKEEDLEKLRNRRLLKQFEEYKEQAFKPKGKIKECRVEALRAGFKHSYQDKDFETIVRVGDRIPNNLLMEDEVLLQFYDIAAGKV